MATAKQLKALRKKHHLGEFSRKRKVNKARSPVINMARRRRSGRFARVKSYAKRKSFSKSEVLGLAIGAGLYTGYKIFLAPQIQKSVPALNGIMPVVETVAGFVLAKNKNNYVRDTGKVMFTVGIIQLINQYVVPAVAPMVSGSTGSAY